MKKMMMLSALALMTAFVYANAQTAANPALAQKTVSPQPKPQTTAPESASPEDEDVIIMEEDDTDPSDEEDQS